MSQGWEPEPALEELEHKARDLGRRISAALGNEPGVPRIGFTLVLFDFGPGGFMSYMANGDRAGVIRMLRELLEKLEKEEA